MAPLDAETHYSGRLGRHPVYQAVREALRAPAGEPVRVGGLVPGAAALFVASLRRELALPVLTLVARPEQAEAFAADASAYAEEEVALLEPDNVVPLKPVSPPPETSASRVRTLLSLAAPNAWAVASAAAFRRRLPPPEELRGAVRRYRPGDAVDGGELDEELPWLGYERVGMVEGPAQYARRGALWDVFPAGEARPLRLEFFGDVVESIREFDVASQRRGASREEAVLFPPRPLVLSPARVNRAVRRIRERYGDDVAEEAYEALDLYRYFDGVENLLPFFYEATATAADYFVSPPLLVVFEAEAVAAAAEIPPLAAEASFPFPRPGEIFVDVAAFQAEFLRAGGTVLTITPGAAEPGRDFRSRDVDHLSGRLELFVDEARRFGREGTAVVALERPDQEERFREMAAARADDVRLTYDVRPARQGFVWDDVGLAVFPAAQLMGRRPRPPRRLRTPRFEAGEEAVRLTSAFDLEPGDLVVHADHGVGRFEGLATLPVSDGREEFITLTYDGGDRLYVPVYNLRLVYKYVGGDPERRPLDRLGGASWRRARARAKKSAEKLARQLIEIYAARAARPGHGFRGDPAWEDELADSFPHVETPDQLRAVEEVAADMATPQPMDRLVCGDVGFGKTEVAVRAALTAVADGKQVAVLVPTTILADQHYATFGRRLQQFGVRVEMLSRFRKAAEQKKIVADLAAGRVDVVIGTHRLLSRDVKFADLGLLVVDEEQHFGVSHKERIKEWRKTVDVLTLTATPIPRTLHMALSGLRDLSLIGTAPLERLPIHTVVAPFDEDLVAEAIARELGRGGQVFFVHNRVQTIAGVADYLRGLVPEARFGVAHGQLKEAELERIMHEFAEGAYDVLVSSAIIEAGLDFPNVNTIVINRADAFGLSQLHQLRGRVGRSHARAFAYLLTPPSHALTDTARQRLAALRDATELGSGFRLAMRDLEIRGAGNLLGPEQSGAVAAVGLDLYTRLLAAEVARLKGETLTEPAEVNVRLDYEAFFPASYIPDERQRLGMYRRLGEAAGPQEVAALAEELQDRFGPPPAAAENLLRVRLISLAAGRAGASRVDLLPGEATLEFARGRFELLASVDVPAAVAAVDVKAGRRGKTLVTLRYEEGAPADETTREVLARFAEAAGDAEFSEAEETTADG
jgi:transcription-repair coupling factor (superfamily II helicase)